MKRKLQSEEMHDYLFDVKLFAAVRVTAPNVLAAREAMRRILDCMDPSTEFLTGFNDGSTVRVTEVSLAEDGEETNEEPVEIDGEWQ